MKKTISILAMTVCLTLLFTACEKENIECGQIEARIIRVDCDRIIFQLMSNDIIGDSVWIDVKTGQQYSNVVSYYNVHLTQELSDNFQRRTFYVNPAIISEERSIQLLDEWCLKHDLAICQAISDSPPQTHVDFTVISKKPCSNEPNPR